jgi:homoserine dehydrogenase
VIAAPSPLGVALLGFGTVGRAVAARLVTAGHPALRLRRICTRRVEASRASAPWIPPDVSWTPRFDDVLTADVQMVIEVIGGLDPARAWITRALGSGRPVVTANKQVLAAHGPALVAHARAHGQAIGFEAAVGGAMPVIRGVQDGLAADRLVRIAGVLNGTSTYVLGRMERGGVTLDAAVAEAQARGFAEADPSADLDGFDARAKLVILAAVGLGVCVAADAVRAGSIRDVAPADFVHAAALGRVIRQVAWAVRSPDTTATIDAGVGPALVDARSWLARAEGARNVVVVTGERSGATVFAGEGAGGDATAVAVLSDALAVANGCPVPRSWPDVRSPVGSGHPLTREWYVRLATGGSPAAAPDLAFARAGLRTRAVLAAPRDDTHGWTGVVEGSCQAVGAALDAWARTRVGASRLCLPLVDLD